MSMFKDFLAQDMQTFFNENEFADKVVIEGQSITVVMDPELLAKKQLSSGGEGLADAELLFYVPTNAISYRIDIGDSITINDYSYSVLTCSEDNDMYVVTVTRYHT